MFAVRCALSPPPAACPGEGDGVLLPPAGHSASLQLGRLQLAATRTQDPAQADQLPGGEQRGIGPDGPATG